MTATPPPDPDRRDLYREGERLRSALRDIVNTLGPVTCEDGPDVRVTEAVAEALATARRALGWANP